MKQEVEFWIKQARHDYEAAGKNCDIGIYDVSLTLCQQAIEKMLKALYICKNEKEPPRTHSLEKLSKLAEINESVGSEILEMDDYYLATRYPDAANGVPYELCNREDAKKALEKTKKVLEIVESRIK